MVARIIKEKGILEFIDAVNHFKNTLNNASFILIGDNYNNKFLKNIKKKFKR